MVLDKIGNICANHRHDHAPYHVYGHGRLLYDDKQQQSWVYVAIPKSASSWMKSVFKAGNWYNYERNQFWNPETNQPDDRWKWVAHKVRKSTVMAAPKNFVVVLRDVVDRWSSGLAQIISPQQHRSCEFERWIDNPIWCPNNHLEPQISFINGLNCAAVTWFLADEHLQTNLVRWAIDHKLLDRLRLPPPVTDDDYNQTAKKHSDIQKFVYGLRQYVRQDPARLARIQDAYAQDIELMATVPFFSS